MKKTIQPSQTVKIDECETSIFYDGSIIVNAAELDWFWGRSGGLYQSNESVSKFLATRNI